MPWHRETDHITLVGLINYILHINYVHKLFIIVVWAKVDLSLQSDIAEGWNQYLTVLLALYFFQQIVVLLEHTSKNHCLKFCLHTTWYKTFPHEFIVMFFVSFFSLWNVFKIVMVKNTLINYFPLIQTWLNVLRVIYGIHIMDTTQTPGVWNMQLSSLIIIQWSLIIQLKLMPYN